MLKRLGTAASLEGFVALGQQAVFSARARNHGKRPSAIVINRVPRDSCGDNDEQRGRRGMVERAMTETNFMFVAVGE